jgi:hypothetical protein
MSYPVRIQRKRTPGWRMPAGTVYVGRGSRWGNPFTSENSGSVHPAIRFACEVAPLLDVTPLRGKSLACWCGPDAECHADVLLDLANPGLAARDRNRSRIKGIAGESARG